MATETPIERGPAKLGLVIEIPDGMFRKVFDLAMDKMKIGGSILGCRLIRVNINPKD